MQTMALATLVTLVATLGVAALPWTDRELEETSTAWATLGNLLKALAGKVF